MIAAGEVSAVEVFNAYRERIEQVNGDVNAIVFSQLEQASQAAIAADRARLQGKTLGPLHGVPFTVKECFQVAGTPTTLGLTHRVKQCDAVDNPLVSRLRAAGGILLGKTNVSQLMLFHESDNPVYGRTNHPLDLSRSPGGSTGGEAAAIAAYCSPLGLGNDLGGSIRLPAAWCGLCGMKPTTHRLTNQGITRNFQGMEAMLSQTGPLARRVEDIALALHVLSTNATESDTIPIPLPNEQAVDVSQLRIIAWEEDGYFPACDSARRAVREAAAALTAAGAKVDWVKPALNELIDLYYALMCADGGANAKQIAHGSQLDPRIARMLWMQGVAGMARSCIVQGYAWSGHTWLARVLQHARPRSAAGYWQLCSRLQELKESFYQQYFATSGASAILSPAHALPALPHGHSVDLLPAASYAFLANLLGIPAGVVPWTNVYAADASSLATGSSFMNQLTLNALKNTTDLPVSVQIMAPSWREDIVLSLLGLLERERKQ